jgi:hypothetical protein
MTATDTRRVAYTTRLSPTAIQLIADRAAEQRVTPSEMCRRMLAYAAARMPRDYIPSDARADTP